MIPIEKVVLQLSIAWADGDDAVKVAVVALADALGVALYLEIELLATQMRSTTS